MGRGFEPGFCTAALLRRAACRDVAMMRLPLLYAVAAAAAVTRLGATAADAAAAAGAAADGYPLAAAKRPIKMRAQRSSSGVFDMENNDDGWHWEP